MAMKSTLELLSLALLVMLNTAVANNTTGNVTGSGPNTTGNATGSGPPAVAVIITGAVVFFVINIFLSWRTIKKEGLIKDNREYDSEYTFRFALTCVQNVAINTSFYFALTKLGDIKVMCSLSGLVLLVYLIQVALVVKTKLAEPWNLHQDPKDTEAEDMWSTKPLPISVFRPDNCYLNFSSPFLESLVRFLVQVMLSSFLVWSVYHSKAEYMKLNTKVRGVITAEIQEGKDFKGLNMLFWFSGWIIQLVVDTQVGKNFVGDIGIWCKVWASKCWVQVDEDFVFEYARDHLHMNCKNPLQRIDLLSRMLMSFLANGVGHVLVFYLIPIILANAEQTPLDFVKDCFAITFIPLIDDVAVASVLILSKDKFQHLGLGMTLQQIIKEKLEFELPYGEEITFADYPSQMGERMTRASKYEAYYDDDERASEYEPYVDADDCDDSDYDSMIDPRA